MITKKQYYKMIDKLPYSIRPKHYERFRENLALTLMENVEPDGYVSTHTAIMKILMVELFEKGLDVSIKTLSEHAIIATCLLYNCSDEDDVEFEFNVPDGCSRSEYNEIFDTLITDLS